MDTPAVEALLIEPRNLYPLIGECSAKSLSSKPFSHLYVYVLVLSDAQNSSVPLQTRR
jgi:hypothetical protein